MSTRKLVAHNFSPVDQARCIRNNLVEAGRIFVVASKLIKSMVWFDQKRENYENYVKRMKKVADLSDSVHISAKILAKSLNQHESGSERKLVLFLFFSRRPKVRTVMYASRGWAGIRAHVGGPRSLRGLHLRAGEVYARATAISSWRDKFRDIFRRGKLMFP